MTAVFAIAGNRPDLLDSQVRAFRQHLAEPHEFVVINNGRGLPGARVRCRARRHHLPVLRVPDPNHTTVNYSHARALEFAYQQLLRREREVALIVEHDVFPFRVFSAHDLLSGAAMAGIQQSRAGSDGRVVRYLHPGLVVLDLRALPEPESLSFWPDLVDGIPCDVGGHMWEYWCRHPEVEVRLLGFQYIEPLGTPGLQLECWGGTFVHYRGASNWDLRPTSFHRQKTRWLHTALKSGDRGPLAELRREVGGPVTTAGSLRG